MTTSDNPISNGDTHPVSECQNCGEPVSSRFARVFGNNQNEVHACLECATEKELYRGSGRAPDVDTSIVSGRDPR